MSDSSGSDDEPIMPPASSLVAAAPGPILDDSNNRMISPGEKLYNQLYDRYPKDHGKIVSRTERKREGYISLTLAYGEIVYSTFAELFAIIEERHGGIPSDGVFVDIGCGIGKAVFAAALLHNFRKCVGIEILNDLYKVCLECAQFWHRTVKPQLGEDSRANLQISFLPNDATMIDFSDADFVFINSTCFNNSLMIDLSLKCKSLKEGAIIVTTTRRIVGSAFELLEELKMEESWGDATVYVQRRCIMDS